MVASVKIVAMGNYTMSIFRNLAAISSAFVLLASCEYSLDPVKHDNAAPKIKASTVPATSSASGSNSSGVGSSY